MTDTSDPTPARPIPPAARPKRAGRKMRKASLFIRSTRTIVALMLREMATTYGRSPGGYLWAFLEPIGGILLITFVFSAGLQLRAPSLGVSFAMFYATGMLAFLMYVRVQGKVSNAINYSRALLHYPAVTFVDAILARLLLNTMTQTFVLVFVAGGLMLITETRTNLDFASIALALVMAATLGLGIGSVNAFLMPFFPVYSSIWGMMTTPLFFLSGILYIYEELPPSGQAVLWYNPLLHVTGMMRKGFYAQYDATFISPLYVFSIAFLTFTAGFILLRRYYRDIVDRSF